MKLKMTLLVVALCAMCGLCACGGNSASSSASDTSSAATSSTTASSASASSSAASSSVENSSSASESSAAGSESGAPIADEVLVGVWDMVAMSNGSDVYRLEDVDKETREGIEMKLEINADGSMLLHNMGTDMPGTWKATSTDKVQLDFEDTADFKDISYTATFEDGMLAIEDSGLVMMLEKTK